MKNGRLSTTSASLSFIPPRKSSGVFGQYADAEHEERHALVYNLSKSRSCEGGSADETSRIIKPELTRYFPQYVIERQHEEKAVLGSV